MPSPRDSAIRLGLVGSGADLVRAIEALKGIPGVRIAVVADASERSEGGKLAKSLQLHLVRNAMEVFRSDANVVLEVSGDERQYERLLSIKPAGVEVMSVRGARLLIDLLQAAPGAEVGPKAASTGGEGRGRIEPLTAALQAALSRGGAPGDAAKSLLPAIAAAARMDLAAVALPSEAGFSWILPSADGEALSRISAEQLGKALARPDPVWLPRPVKGLGRAGLLQLRIGQDVLGLLAVARSQDTAPSAEELTALRLGADFLAAALRATQSAPTQIVKEVPVEIVREVIKEVVKEVPVEVEVVREVIKEVPVEVLRDVVKEVIKEVRVPVEVVREVEVIKEVVRDVPVEVVREVIKEVRVPVEVIKEVVKEVPVEVVREVEVVKEVIKEVPVEVEVVREVIKEVRVPVEVVREVEVIKEIVRDVPVEVVREVIKEVPVEVFREVVREVEVIKEIVRDVPVEVIKEVIKEVPVEVFRDTTQVDQEEMRRLRRRVEELQTAHEHMTTRGGGVPLDEKMQALLNMAAGVGHVFNNVLAGVLGRTQLLLKRAAREKSKELLAGLSEIESATRTGIDALTRVQEFSRARPSEAFGPVDLNDVVQRAVEQTRPKWRDESAAKGVRIELITHFGPHSRIVGAESEFLEAVVQLIINAVEAMPRGGTLTIRTGLESGRGVISVSDTGVGMPESVRRRAFEPFFSTKGETGLGLGLSMVYGVMARHGGEPSIESEEGTGTTITLRVPTSGEGAPVQVTIHDSDRVQVLLVDDDDALRTAVGDMLRGAGYAIALAASGLEGIAKVRERETPFDLVVTDLGMPDVPGWEVVEAVKQVDGTTPVVIMSGFDRARATRRAKELGVDFVITKPFDIQEFLNTIRGLVAVRKRP